jgi:hypothetical protein
MLLESYSYGPSTRQVEGRGGKNSDGDKIKQHGSIARKRRSQDELQTDVKNNI